MVLSWHLSICRNNSVPGGRNWGWGVPPLPKRLSSSGWAARVDCVLWDLCCLSLLPHGQDGSPWRVSRTLSLLGLTFRRLLDHLPRRNVWSSLANFQALDGDVLLNVHSDSNCGGETGSVNRAREARKLRWFTIDSDHVRAWLTATLFYVK